MPSTALLFTMVVCFVVVVLEVTTVGITAVLVSVLVVVDVPPLVVTTVS